MNTTSQRAATDDQEEKDAPGDVASPDVDELPDELEGDDAARRRDNFRRRALVRIFWNNAKGFWGRGGDRYAWVLTIGLLLLVLMALGVDYGINLWNRWIFDAIADRATDDVLHYSLIFIPLAVMCVGFGVAQVYVRMTLQRRWRAWVTLHIVDRWLKNGRYFQLNLIAGDHDNPEYRIAEDIRIATDAPIDFVTAMVTAALSVITFSGVLFVVGGSLDLNIIGIDAEVPGFLVLAALIYAVIASGAMIFIGRDFIRISEQKNQAEADYRYTLTRIRENGESIALLQGEQEERAGLERTLKVVFHRWRQLCGQYMRTTIVSSSSNVVAPVVPIILSAPKFLDGAITLGEVMQAASAFTIVQAGFGVIVQNYPRFADWSASARRSASLMRSLQMLEQSESGEGVSRIERKLSDECAIRLCNLSVTLGDGTAVVDDTDVRIMPGERVLVAGESGSGKSTLVRAIAGLWPWGGGAIELNSKSRLFFLPQKPYVPVGPLLRAASYPAPSDEFDVGDVAKALQDTGLGHLAEKLECEEPWDSVLSGGEKQRLAFARLLLHKPEIVVLDESTSALDPNSQDVLMALIAERLSDATIVSVGHRPELEAFHDRKIVLARRDHGAKLISDLPLPKARPKQRRRWSWQAQKS